MVRFALMLVAILGGHAVAVDLTLTNQSNQVYTGQTYDDIILVGCTNITFDQCTFDYLRASGSDGIVVDSCQVDASGDTTRGAVVFKSDNCVVRDTTILLADVSGSGGNVHTGITFGADTVDHTGGLATGNTIVGGYTGIGITKCDDVVVQNNKIRDCKTTNHSQAVIATECEGVEITGNLIRNIDYTGIALVDCEDCEISNNRLYNPTEGESAEYTCGIAVGQTASGATSGITITDNVLWEHRNSTGSSSPSGMNLRGNNHWVERNSIFVQKAGGQVRGIILMNSTGCTFRKNTIAAERIGIYCLSSANSNTFTDNSIGAGVYPIIDLGTGNTWTDDLTFNWTDE